MQLRKIYIFFFASLIVNSGSNPKAFSLRFKSFIHDYLNTKWIDTSNSNDQHRMENASYPAKNLRGQALVSFINSLLTYDKKVLVSKEDVFNVMSICLAAEQAINSRETVLIEYL